ncbi:hypothetical protein COCVIDRAFT_42471 [Bipolaris victoriae FI3]|uniref:Major facilitator superfamily (MFS) profile domain-containing protein n=1 Tax=Bipolaris victoriae (strain FI3) TaxID=930091 RepID=W7E6M7_BIPV3|nr:hypothetical protein COCVIDRAFT_42471 [Bipolaris victoriae FI3]
MTNMSKTDREETSTEHGEKAYPPFKIVFTAMIAIWLAFFVVALDRTIIGTAVPTISQQFQSFGDIAWYESGYLLPFCVLQLSFGRIYRYYSAKWTMVLNIAIFEVGSIICAAAPSSKALIVGRVISGIGGAGVSPGAFLLITFLVPMQSRPKYIGSLGSVFGITSILGPILGGYLTSITWRWCFWINLPVGVISIVLLVLLTPNCPPPAKRAITLRDKFFELDPLGFVLIATSLVCLLLAIQFGRNEYAWGSGVIIALFVISGTFAIAFVGFQIWRGENGTIPPRIISQRSIFAGSIASLGIGSVLVLFAFYLPIWFQVVQGKSPQDSGLSLIPLLLSVVVAVITSGVVTSKIGYYLPPLLVGAAIVIVGSGLMSTWSVDVGSGKWIGFQGPNIAAQTVLAKQDLSIGYAVINQANFLGSTVFVTVGQALLQSKLAKLLEPILPDTDLKGIGSSGAISVREDAPAGQLGAVLFAYNDAIRSIWYLALGLSCLTLLASLGIEWGSVIGQSPTDDEELEGHESHEKVAGLVKE